MSLSWTCLAKLLFLHLFGAGAISVTAPQRGRVANDEMARASRNGAGGAKAGLKEWPDFPVEPTEIILGNMPGGTHPKKVMFKGFNHAFVRKKVLSGSTEGIMMEAMANNMYDAVGVQVPRCRYYAPVPKMNNTAYMLCHWIEGLAPVKTFTDAVKRKATQHFVLDALMQNYDAGGMVSMESARGNLCENSKGELVRVDTGGSLAVTGVGEWKPTEYDCDKRLDKRVTTWSPEPFALWDLRLWTELYHIYPNLSGSRVEEQATWVIQKKNKLLKAMDDFDQNDVMKKVKETFQARMSCLEKIVQERAELLNLNASEAKLLGWHMPARICEGVRQLCAGLHSGES